MNSWHNLNRVFHGTGQNYALSVSGQTGIGMIGGTTSLTIPKLKSPLVVTFLKERLFQRLGYLLSQRSFLGSGNS